MEPGDTRSQDGTPRIMTSRESTIELLRAKHRRQREKRAYDEFVARKTAGREASIARLTAEAVLNRRERADLD